MALLSLLRARTQAAYEANLAAAHAELQAVFEPSKWGIDLQCNTYTEQNIANIWRNELRTSIKDQLEASGKSMADYEAWLQEVHFINVAVYWRSLFETYRSNIGWRILLLSVPSVDVVAFGLASHYQQAQKHNLLGQVSNLLHDFAKESLTSAHAGDVLVGRKVAAEDWDKAGLILHPITQAAGVDVSPRTAEGVWLKDVRTTTVKKIIASFITVEPLDPTSVTDTSLAAGLRQLEQSARHLAEDVYPFRDLRQFEELRALALADLAAARMRFQLRQKSRSRSVVRIYYGPPGTGKTLSAVRDAVKLADPTFESNGDMEKCFVRFNELKEQLAFLTFHQSLQYEDVVESIRPLIGYDTAGVNQAGGAEIADAEDHSGDTDAQQETEGPQTGDKLRYYLYQGPFMRMIRRAAENPDKEYVLVVDEINRGDVSRIMGPLISAIEPDKRVGAEFPIGFEAQYPRAAELESRIFVPANLHIVGTMNSADRNIALVDYALRRRFEFIESLPQHDLLHATTGSPSINLSRLISTINDRIRYLIDKDHCLGHGYFMRCRSNQDVVEAFARRVLPLLTEYFYGNEAQLLLVLGERIGGTNNIFKIERAETAFETLFGMDVDAAVGLGYRAQQVHVSVSLDPRFWNPNRLVAGPDDENYAVRAISKIYEESIP
jgi:5-methylcytosine-specific restriction protein B